MMSKGRALAVAGLMCVTLGMSLPAWAEEPAAKAPAAEAVAAEAAPAEAAAVEAAAAEAPKVDVAAAVAEPAAAEGSPAADGALSSAGMPAELPSMAATTAEPPRSTRAVARPRGHWLRRRPRRASKEVFSYRIFRRKHGYSFLKVLRR